MTVPLRLLMPLVALVTVVALAGPAAAQDPISSTTTPGAPTQDIVPEPNSGAAPTEAGDRGGALQLAVLAVVVLVIAGAVAGLVRQSRRARGFGYPSSRRASQATAPSRKPER